MRKPTVIPNRLHAISSPIFLCGAENEKREKVGIQPHRKFGPSYLKENYSIRQIVVYFTAWGASRLLSWPKPSTSCRIEQFLLN